MDHIGLYATSFAARIGAGSQSRNSLIDNLPPLLADAQDIQIDVTALILYGSLHLDVRSFDFVTSNKYSKTQRLARQLIDLADAGLLHLHDFSLLGDGSQAIIRSTADHQIANNVEFWLGELRKCIKYWEDNRSRFYEAYGKKYQAESSIPFSIKAVLDANDVNSVSLKYKMFVTPFSTTDIQIMLNLLNLR